MLNFGMTNEATNALTKVRQPRIAIRRSDASTEPFNWKGFLVLNSKLFAMFCLCVIMGITFGYIQHLRRETFQLKGQVSLLQSVGEDNAIFVDWIRSSLSKTVITPYVPYLRGINGGGKVYANGEPVIPIAASRKALKNGSVVMGDRVLLVGEIMDTKGKSIKDHSFDIHVPDMNIARILGKREFQFINLTRTPPTTIQ